MRQIRLGIVVTHPIQYQVPLFRCLAERGRVEPLVFFLTRHGIAESFDVGFGRAIKFDIPLLDGYLSRMVPNWSLRPNVSTVGGAFNPSLPKYVWGSQVDALLVHGYSSISHWIAYVTAMAARIPYLMRGDSRPDGADISEAKAAAKHAIIGPLIRRASACLAVGSDNYAFYREYGAQADRIFFAPYSIDTERFSTAGALGRDRRSSLVTSLGLQADFPVILFAGKLLARKRPADLVMAMDRLERRASLVMIGDGPLRPMLEGLAADRPWMRMVGFVNQQDIAMWYGAADLFVLPSSDEPWGLVVNEAMAAGAVPIVSDSVGCAPDLVTSDVGWVYPTGDVSALAHALSEACQSGAIVLRRDAAQLRSKQYSLSSTAEGIEAAIAAVLERRGLCLG